MADNTRQLRWIFVLYGNLAAQFRTAADIFVGSNQFWYPEEGRPDLRVAPDVYVVFGRPKGDRDSYKQWEEGNIPLTVVIEVLSPGNTVQEMIDKLTFYDEYGVEEYYLYDPDDNRLTVFVRRGETLRRVRPVAGFVSPRLGIRFDTSGPELQVFWSDGRRFLTFEELDAQWVAAEQRAIQAEQRAIQAEQRTTQAEQRATQAEQRAARLAELSRKARRQQATAEELAELDRLERSDFPSS
ncbi:MAG: Uma2 family endonuclease [Gemmataceae bacterium]|nr:Uma2 family endonuclease [Gemmataceae bacterium]